MTNPMLNLAARLHVLGVRINDWLDRHIEGDKEAGSITIEQVLWAGFVVLIMGVVAAVLNSFITGKLAALK